MIKIKQLFDEITKQKVYPITTLKAVKDPKSKKSLSDLMIVGEGEEIIGELGKRDCDTLGGKYKSTDIDSAMTCDEDEELGVVEDVTIVDADRLGGKYTADDIDTMFSNCYAKLKVIGETGCIVTLSDGQSGVIDASGSIVFSVYYGEYTIQVTKGGSTSTYTVTIDTLKIYELVVGFSITNWLRAGKISTDYASVSEIPEKDIRQLMTIHASVDYLVDSIKESCVDDATEILNNDIVAKWINLRDYALDMLYTNPVAKSIMGSLGKYGYGEWALIDGVWQPKGAVPVMTSNTAPYGEASASSYWSKNGDSTPAYYVFDKNNGSYWLSANGTYTNQWVQYKFINPINVKRIILQNASLDNKRSIKNFKIQASNDGSTWVDLLSATNPESTANLATAFDINNDNYYMIYRLYAIDCYYYGSSSSDQNMQIGELQFYGRQLNVSVPVMTSNTAPWGEAIGDKEFSDGNPFVAFDKDATTFWYSKYADGKFLGYDFKKPIKLRFVSVKNRNFSGVYVVNFKIQGSNDNITWDDLGEFTNTVTTSGGISTYKVDAENYYKCFRMVMLSGVYNNSSTGAYYQIAELNFYGVDYSEREFEEGSTMKYIYDHGVELEEIIQEGTGGTFAKNQSSIECIDTSTSDHVLAVIKNSIDLTPFSLIRCNTLKGTSINSIGMIALVKNIGNPETPTYKFFETCLAPNNQYCDISSVNESYYINVSAGSDSATGNVEFSEWWLE